MPDSTNIFELSSIYYSVMMNQSTIEILKGVDLKVAAGSSIAIMGNSGSGKSTLLNIMAGLIRVSQGHIHCHGENLCQLSEDELANWRLQKLAFIFQSFELLDNLTALENILFPIELRGEKKAKDIALSFLDKVSLADRASHFPKTLSGGEKQRVAIARAFALSPQILLADEPTGNLDEKTGALISDLMFELNTKNTTLIIVTHSKKLAARADVCYQLENGQLVC